MSTLALLIVVAAVHGNLDKCPQAMAACLLDPVCADPITNVGESCGDEKDETSECKSALDTAYRTPAAMRSLIACTREEMEEIED